MSENKFPYFPFDVVDWLTSPAIMSMTAEEEGAYIRLLALAWTDSECGIPSDPDVFAKLARLTPGSSAATTVQRMFNAHPTNREKLHNPRLYRDWLRVRESREKQKEAGKASATKRAAIAKGPKIKVPNGPSTDPQRSLESTSTKERRGEEKKSERPARVRAREADPPAPADARPPAPASPIELPPPAPASPVADKLAAELESHGKRPASEADHRRRAAVIARRIAEDPEAESAIRWWLSVGRHTDPGTFGSIVRYPDALEVRGDVDRIEMALRRMDAEGTDDHPFDDEAPAPPLRHIVVDVDWGERPATPPTDAPWLPKAAAS